MPPHNTGTYATDASDAEINAPEPGQVSTIVFGREVFGQQQQRPRYVREIMYAIDELPELAAIRHTQADTDLYLGRSTKPEGTGVLYVDERCG